MVVRRRRAVLTSYPEKRSRAVADGAGAGDYEVPGMSGTWCRGRSELVGGVLVVVRGEHLLELGLGLVGGDEEQLVVELQGAVRVRGEDAALAEDRDQGGVGGPGDVADPGADHRRVLGQRQLDQVRVALAEGEQPDKVADRHRLLDQRGHDPRGRDGDVDAPRLVEHPLVPRVVDPGNGPGYAELGLGEQRDDQVDLVVAGTRDGDLAALQRGLLQRGQLAGVGQQPLGPRHRLGLDGARVLVDQQHLVAVLQQFGGDRATDVAGTGDGYPHHSSSGLWPSWDSIAAASLSSITTWTRSPSWMTVSGRGSRPSPSRVRNATRAPVAFSMSNASRPTHSECTCTSASRTVPDGSRHSGSEPSGSSRRIIWSTVQRTVPTVGMPSRWYTSARPGS